VFGKGGSAIATPLLSLIGYSGYIVVASPLPATVPGTLLASGEYWESHLLDWEIVWWSIGVGVPATILGSLLTKYTGARPFIGPDRPARARLRPLLLDLATRNGLAKRAEAGYWGAISAFVLVFPARARRDGSRNHLGPPGQCRRISAGAGVRSILRQPVKKSFACSLAVSAVLALPGTAAHAYLGHVSWKVAGLIALGSAPFSYQGARVAIRTKASRLERIYGMVLTALGAFFLYQL
jgi:uncharacterized protein